ncbi:helix-turn-helix domain-containing protein [Streptomyces millisiae]|uniref:Helix-turn-helix domain-containing protein n=1 Tax=Streptomyces millisiae TaxID=3075542 RepID=A0ABU2LM78_9ACTN|nr:helix-turn-helix domain-containing protein [Streptomyces sp. DSM 44918]MDT0318679.1 helix-turn-helix domain-containing protein [Streptomyces sp. DSM 44918]
MKGLLLRLSSLDADAAAAVRVIAHFQALLAAGRLDPAALARSAAGLAECPVGVELAGGRIFRAGPDGAGLAGPPGRASGQAALRPAGRVWLERPGEAGPFDDLLLEWLAIAAHTLEHPLRVADPALVEVALSARESLADRARALRLLGLAPEAPLRVLVFAAADGGDAEVAALALLGRGAVPGTLRVARLGGLGVALLQDRAAGAGSPAVELRSAVRGGVRVGIGGGVEAPRARHSLEQASVALRFAAAGPPAEAVVDHDELGPAAVLAEVPAARLGALPDVRRLGELAARDGGELNLAALAAFCRTGSLRQAAAELHLHHSSVAARLGHVQAATGWRLRDPAHRFRAQLALYARRLALAPAEG